MYAILIKDTKNNGLYRFLSVKKEIMESTEKEVTDPDTNEVKTETVEVGTGNYENVIFFAETKDELEKKCVELLSTYTTNEFMPIDTEPFNVDLVWDSDNN